MDIEKRFVLLQNTYAASIAETVNTYDKLKVLDTIVECFWQVKNTANGKK